MESRVSVTIFSSVEKLNWHFDLVILLASPPVHLNVIELTMKFWEKDHFMPSVDNCFLEPVFLLQEVWLRG